ncbi:DUF3258 domain-containing protein [Aestuariirhabdus sp. LZHN29]|uniref:DUF3258 domain-containing protein n=1 Tax=Aestuariirhabdus sp. LZHN29 TaxID=3417462 RepID=UPI003CF0C196
MPISPAEVEYLKERLAKLADIDSFDWRKREAKRDAVYYERGHIAAVLEGNETLEEGSPLKSFPALNTLLSVLDAELSRSNGLYTESVKAKEEAQNRLREHTKEEAEKAESTTPSKGILFSKLYEEFIEFKRTNNNLSERILKEYERYYIDLLHLIGDKPIDQINRKCLRDALSAYAGLPKRNLKEYKGRPVEELLNLEIPEEDRISKTTTSQLKKFLQGMFSFAVANDYLSSSPAKDLKLALTSKKTYARFTDSEVVAILNEVSTSKQKKEWQRWLPILAAYTGARRSELCQLRKQDIAFDAESQRHYIQITPEAGNLKTDNAIRQIPIHAVLVKAGFLDWVATKPEGELFSLNPQSLTSWFGRVLRKLEIPQTDERGNKKVFHSFRHGVVTKARGAGCLDLVVQTVVGHEKTSAGVTDRYTHALPLKDVLRVIDCLSYE